MGRNASASISDVAKRFSDGPSREINRKNREKKQKKEKEEREKEHRNICSGIPHGIRIQANLYSQPRWGI